MAKKTIAVTATTINNTSGSSATSLVTSHTHPSGSNALVVMVGHEKLGIDPFPTISVDFGAQSFGAATIYYQGSARMGVAIFTLLGAAAGTANVTITLNNGHRFNTFIHSLSNVEAIKASGGVHDDNTSNVAKTLTTSLATTAGELMLGMSEWRISSATFSVGTGETGGDDQGVNSQDSRGGYSYKTATGTPTALSHSVANRTGNHFTMAAVTYEPEDDGFDGAGAVTLGALSSAAAGSHETPIFAGDAAAMLGTILAQGAGAQAFAFSGDAAAILPALAAAGTATVAITFNGDGSATLGGLSAAGEATWTTVFNGDGAAQLAALLAAAEATHTGPAFTANSEALLAGLLVSAAGTHVAPLFTGAGAATLSPLAAAAAGSFAATFPADGAAQLAALATAGAGSHAGPIFIGDATATLAALIAAAEASHTAPQFTATAETALAALQALADGGHSLVTFAAAGEATLGALAAGGTAEWSEFVPGAPGGRRGGLWPWGLRMGGG